MSPKTKNLLAILGLAVIVLIIGGVTWFFITQGHPNLPSSDGATPQNPFGNAITPGNIQDTHAPAVTYPDHAQYYTIDLQYPSSTALAGTAGAQADIAAVQAMKTFTQQTADGFKADGNLDHLTAEDIKIQGLDDERKYTLSDTYQFYSSPVTISYFFTIYSDTLGAHPNGYFKTFTFDGKSGKNLALSDLFSPGAGYLARLSTLASAALTSQMGADADPDGIKEGTTPSDDNFQNFVLDGQNLVIFFPPYQVAAYAAGSQTVKIPLSKLSDILNPAYKQ